MALLGILSVVQIVFLPGYLLARALRLGGGILATLVLAFALSLVANHALVAGLVVLGIYRPGVVYAVFAAETALFLWSTRRSWRSSMIDVCRFPAGDLLAALRRGPLRPVLRAVAMAVIAGFALAEMAQIGHIFQQWDAVVSWNRWAIDWAANHLPRATSLYPQLLPANDSLTYVFMQSSEVWIFAKAFQFLFCLMLLLAMLDAARATGNFGYVPGVIITYWLLVAVLRFRMISSGYADMPLAFMSFAAVYALLLARQAEGAARRVRYLMTGAVLAAGAALTKQTGLYIAAVYPLLAWRFVLRGQEDSPRHTATLLRVALLMGALIAPWYLYKFVEFHTAWDHNNTALLLTYYHEGRSLPQRILHGASLFAEAVTPAGALLLLLAIAAGLRDPLQRWLVGLVVLPLGLIWAAAFSYDLRNLSLILPLAGAAAGSGLLRAAEWLGKRLPRSEPVGCVQRTAGEMVGSARSQALENGPENSGPLRATHHRSSVLHPPYDESCRQGGLLRRVRVGHVAGLVALAVVTASLCVSDKTLRECQARQQRLVGIPELNERLYAYFQSHRDPGVIATDYQAMAWLPELGPRSVPCNCERLESFRTGYDRPDVRYALARYKGAAKAVREYLGGPAAHIVFKDGDYRLYEKP